MDVAQRKTRLLGSARALGRKFTLRFYLMENTSKFVHPERNLSAKTTYYGLVQKD